MNSHLDRIDFALIEALQNNARLSNKELASRVGLAPSSTHGRVKRLLQLGVFTGFHAEVQPEALGIDLQAMIHVSLREHTAEHEAEFKALVEGEPAVLAWWYVGGSDDFLIHVAVRSTAHLRQVVDLITTKRISRVRTQIIFETRRRRAQPIYRD